MRHSRSGWGRVRGTRNLSINAAVTLGPLLAQESGVTSPPDGSFQFETDARRLSFVGAGWSGGSMQHRRFWVRGITSTGAALLLAGGLGLGAVTPASAAGLTALYASPSAPGGAGTSCATATFTTISAAAAAAAAGDTVVACPGIYTEDVVISGPAHPDRRAGHHQRHRASRRSHRGRPRTSAVQRHHHRVLQRDGPGLHGRGCRRRGHPGHQSQIRWR
jgi:hypothetical protein